MSADPVASSSSASSSSSSISSIGEWTCPPLPQAIPDGQAALEANGALKTTQPLKLDRIKPLENIVLLTRLRNAIMLVGETRIFM